MSHRRSRSRYQSLLAGFVAAGPTLLATPVNGAIARDLPTPRFPVAPPPTTCTNTSIDWKFAFPAGTPGGFPTAADEATVRAGINKWLGDGLKKTNGDPLFTLNESATAPFKVYLYELGLAPNGEHYLGGFSCNWHSASRPWIPENVPAIVLDPESLAGGSSVATHEMGHALGLNHVGWEESLTEGTTGGLAAMNTCRIMIPNSDLFRDDYAQAQYRVQGFHNANPGFESTAKGWTFASGQIATNPEAGNGSKTFQMNSPSGWVSTATRVEPRKNRVLLSARFKGATAATNGVRFKAYYRTRYVPYATPTQCEDNQFFHNLNLDSVPHTVPAFTLLYSLDFNVGTSWSGLPAFTGSSVYMPDPGTTTGGEYITDFKIAAENLSGDKVWVDSFGAVAI